MPNLILAIYSIKLNPFRISTFKKLHHTEPLADAETATLRRRGKVMVLKFHSIFSRTENSCEGNSVAISDIPIAGENGFGGDNRGTKPLSAVADAFEEISAVVKSRGFRDLDMKTFCEACSLVSILFGCLGMAFKFAEMEYVSKVSNLTEASKRYRTLNSVLDLDIQNDTVKTSGSFSRNLRRVRQGLDLIRALFQNFLSTEDDCLRESATTAYAKTCAPYHTWAVRTAAYAGMYALPTRDQLLLKLNETNESAERQMIRYINASLPVIEYIDKLYSSRNISLDW